MAVAKYTEIYIALRARIEGGRYAFRQFLPSEKALTAEFGVTRNTLRKALRHLSSQGYVQSMQGRGVQVIYRPRTSPRIFLSNIESFAEASERMGMTPSTVLLSSQRTVVDDALASVSGLAGRRGPRLRRPARRPDPLARAERSEERRVGEECRSRRSPYH